MRAAAITLPSHATSALRARLGPLALGVWFAVMVAVGATQLAHHLLPLPTVARAAGVSAAAFAALRRPDERGRWMAFHVLLASCRCSQRVAAHLASEPRPAGVAERVLLVGRDVDLERALAVAGLGVVRVAPDELAARFGIQAAPTMVVADARDVVRFAGGYTERSQALVVRDADVLAALRAGRAPPTLPVYGCAVGAALRARTNPLGL